MRAHSLLLLAPLVLTGGCSDYYKDPLMPAPVADASKKSNSGDVRPRSDNAPQPTEQTPRPVADPVVNALLALPNFAMTKLLPAPASTRYELRLRGENGFDYSAAWLGVREVAFGVDGKRIPSETAVAAAFDVSTDGQAWLVGKFDVPDDATAVDVVLRFDSYGAYETAYEVGAIDARGPALHFTAPVSSLKLRGRAVIHLDLAQSLVRTDAGDRMLLRNYLVKY